MNRNTILYILVALLVVGGITWLVVARTSEDRITGDTTDGINLDDTEDEEDADTTDEGDDTDVEDTNEGISDTPNGTVPAPTGVVSETPSTGGAGEAVVPSDSTDGTHATGEQITGEQLRTRLELQIALFEALVSVVAVQLEEEEITPEEAESLLQDLTEVGEALEETVELYQQRF